MEVKQLVGNGVIGDVMDLAVYLLDLPELRRKMGEGGREKAFS